MRLRSGTVETETGEPPIFVVILLDILQRRNADKEQTMTLPSPTSQFPESKASREDNNSLALVSFLFSLVVPALVLGAIVAGILNSAALYNVFSGLVGEVIIPLSIVVIVLGHLALGQAKRFPADHAWRGFAIAG